MLVLYVDGDSCPVKDEIITVAQRHKMEVYIVSNSYLRPINSKLVKMILVAEGADVADDWIADHAVDKDIVITADILLAQRCLNNNASVINHTGKPFTNDNIGSAVAGRDLSAHLREIGVISGGNPTFQKKDRSKFLQALEETIQKIKRTI
jgi:uncharacterized protein YaiI (UPF0178 family)